MFLLWEGTEKLCFLRQARHREDRMWYKRLALPRETQLTKSVRVLAYRQVTNTKQASSRYTFLARDAHIDHLSLEEEIIA